MTKGSARLSLEGRVAVVTGGGSGIGKAVACGLAAAGAVTCVVDVNGDAATMAAQEVGSRGGSAAAYESDVTSRRATEVTAREIATEIGDVDVLVNCAGILTFGSVVDRGDADWRRVLAVNLDGTYHWMSAVLPSMAARAKGAVVNTGSSFSSRGSVFNADGGSPGYVVSKAAVQALTRKAAYDVARFGVRVNCVAPGTVDTPMHDPHRDVVEALVPSIPLRRLASPADIVGPVVFLAGDAAAYITGQTLHVNGGQLMVD